MLRTGRGLFCLVVAVCAATLADPMVEAASNAGFFGPHTFTDHSSLDVVPALVTSVLLGLTYVALQVRRTLTARTPFDGWLRDALAARARERHAPLLPTTFAIQLAVLFGMETVEQIIVTGHALGGTIWLGAPIAIAVAIHLAACAFTSYVLGRALDALARVAVVLAVAAWAILLERSHDAGCGAIRMRELPLRGRTNPLAFRSGLRAPPLSRA